MKLKRTCRDVTRLVLEGEERRLSLVERLQVRLHMWICAACPRFERQVHFMRQAMGAWRGYAEGDDVSPRVRDTLGPSPTTKP